MNLLSLFSGIGAFEKALKNEGIDYNLVNYCEIDKYASKSYSAIHNVSEALNLTDVTKIDTTNLPNVDLITYGFPCQDISQAGHQKGFADENGERTRSGLFFEALRIIKDLRPKYAIAENVKALTSKKFAKEFDVVLSSLNEIGYDNYWKVLNAKDFGIPQSRERVFIVSIRKDIDDYSFQFPSGEILTKLLRDFLETEVAEEFYKKEARTQALIEKLVADGYQPSDGVQNIKQVGNFIHTGNFSNPHRGRVYDANALSPGLNCCGGGGREVKIVITPRDRCEPCALTKDTAFRIRKLTPKEYWRLMGFSDEDFDKAKAAGISNSQLYKQAGNSIVVPVLQGIFKNLFKDKEIKE